jgi:hypothetical protein
VFSLYRNHSQTLEFFNKIEMKARNSETVYFDMEQVKELSVDSIIYFLALMRYYRILGKPMKVEGNVPTLWTTRYLLQQCGFFKFVNSSSDTSFVKDSDTIQIKDGRLADTKALTQNKRFT